MKKLGDLTKEERSLLIYIESVCVDYGGLVHSQRINEADFAILEQWDKDRFISFCRLTWASVQMLQDKHNSSIVYLSEEAWKLAHEERRARYIRVNSRPPICNLITTKTKNADFIEQAQGTQS